MRNDPPALRDIEREAPLTLSLGKGNQRIRGPEIEAVAQVLPSGESAWARHLLLRKYWLLRIPFAWDRRSVLVEITLA